MQVLGSLTGCGGLGDVALGCAQVGNVLDERDEARHQSYLGDARVASDRSGAQQSGCATQAVPGRRSPSPAP